MVEVKQDVFYLETKNTSYILKLKHGKYIENLYYGRKIRNPFKTAGLEEKHGAGYGNTILTPEDETLTLENICLDFSSQGVGDYRENPCEVIMPDGSFSTRFEYVGYEVYDGTYSENDMTNLPYAKAGEDSQTLCITLKDTAFSVTMNLIYTVFPECDCITRRFVLKNEEETAITIRKLMSMQLDLPETGYQLETFDGLWTRERKRNVKELISGTYVNGSTTGCSSNRHNPFFMLSKKGCTEQSGDCIGSNLIYSGNHYEAVEVSEYGKLRLVSGIHPHAFQWKLNTGESFYTPEAVLSFSHEGRDGLSKNMHQFVSEHIVPASWRKKERPILLNNWEATYFDFTKGKLVKLAKEAKKLGMELFVLDDGWFGERNNDKTSLGDWTVNEKKMGGTLKELADEIHKMGLLFGLWVEPEMISEKSKLFEEHPDYAVVSPNHTPYQGRNQLVLDFTRKEVCDYIVTAMVEIITTNGVDYIKWDMNRHLTDGFSQWLGENQGEFFHRYVLGLYDVMGRIVDACPNVLFEGCSAGGNRFDLGMLCYMSQIWTSDDTDANERITIQEGTSYGYPLSTMGAHVSCAPNHQTLRHVNLETRFEVACFGDLGYELDVTKLTKAEEKAITKQIEFYKKYRRMFQFGNFSRSKMDNGSVVWQVVSDDKKQAIAMVFRRLTVPNCSNDLLKVEGLNPDALYQVSARKQAISIKQFGNLVNQVTPVNITEGGMLQAAIDKVYQLESEEESYETYGDMLSYAGLKLKQKFTGSGYNENVRIMEDFSSRLYVIEQIDSENVTE